MEISQYWVGQIPTQAISINLLDGDGNPKDCNAYTFFDVRLIGSDNEFIDLRGGQITPVNLDEGTFIFSWPPRVIFDKEGDYLLQMLLYSGSGLDMTSLHTIRVRDPKKVRR